MTVTVGYARFRGGCTRCHQARIVIPRRTGRIVLGCIVVTMRTISGCYATATECTGDVVVNSISVGILTICPCSAGRFGCCTVTCTGGADAVVNRITVGILTGAVCLTSSRLGSSTVTGTGRADAIVTGYTALSAGRICLTSSRFGAGNCTARCTITFNRGAGTVLIQRIVANRKDARVLDRKSVV